MKYLAILRDSVREALDAKIIYVLFALSVLVIFVVASISFSPEPGEKGLEGIIKRFPGAQGNFNTPPPLTYAVKDFQQTNEPAPVWEGAFRYDLVVTENQIQESEEDEEGQPKAEKQPPPPGRQMSTFRFLVLMQDLLQTPESELSDEDKEARRRTRRLLGEVIRAGGKITKKQEKKLAEDLSREANQVSKERLEKFIQRQLTGNGAMEVTNLRLVSEEEKKFLFRVECKAGPETVRTWPHSLAIFFGALSLPIETGVGNVVYAIERYMVAGLGAGLSMLIGTIVTAFFIPNMLRKGTLDLLIAKPVQRIPLLLTKYIGGLTFMFLTTLVIVVGVWLALGFRSGLWGTGFLLSVFIITLQFGIFYAISTLLGVLTRSPIVCILCAVAFWFLLFLVSLALGILKPFTEFKVIPEWPYQSVDITRKILPRYHDLDNLNSQLIARDLLPKESPQRKAIDKEAEDVNWFASLSVTLAFITLLLALASWRFAVKDY